MTGHALTELVVEAAALPWPERIRWRVVRVLTTAPAALAPEISR